MQNKVDYLKSQGGSMITMECGGKLCVELDPNVKESYALDNGTRPLGIVREVRYESRIAVIEDYRRTAESIEATTARARESTTNHSAAIIDHRAAQELRQRVSAALELGSERKRESSQVNQGFTETPAFAVSIYKLEKNLNLHLQTRLEKLVGELEIESHTKRLLAEILPNLVQIEIEKQTAPLAMQITERMRSVEQFQQKLAELIQALSGKL